jgi:hypothetical protein
LASLREYFLSRTAIAKNITHHPEQDIPPACLHRQATMSARCETPNIKVTFCTRRLVCIDGGLGLGK